MIRKKLVIFLLSALLICNLMLPAYAYPISFHYNADSYTVDCNHQTVTVTAAKDHQTGYLLIRLADTSGTVVRQKAASAKNEIELSAAGLSDGLYYVEIFTGSAPSGNYTAYASETNTIQIRISNGIASMIISDTWVYNLNLYLQNRSDSFALNYYSQTEKNVMLKTLAEQITAGCDTDYEKIKAVHDWITAHICYDYDHKDSEIKTNAVSVSTLHYTNAQGYANLTAELLRQSGIAAKVVSGYAQTTNAPLTTDHKNAEAHHWNEAYDAQNKRWIILDTCWDSTNVYENGKLSFANGYHRYFDPTLEAFSVDHLLDQNEDSAGLKKAFLAEVQKASVNFSRTVLYTGAYNHTAQISVTLPDSIKDCVSVTYSTGNKNKVSVTKKGKLTGTGYGKTNITVKISDGTNSYTVKQTVKCYNPFLKFEQSASSLKVGKSYTYKVSKYGVSGTVKWNVSDKTVASVTSSGKLTAKKAGTVTLTANVDGVKISKKVKITK